MRFSDLAGKPVAMRHFRPVEYLADNTLSVIHVYYPDPWPKAKHHRRRFIGPENLPHLARIAAPGAQK